MRQRRGDKGLVGLRVMDDLCSAHERILRSERRMGYLRTLTAWCKNGDDGDVEVGVDVLFVCNRVRLTTRVLPKGDLGYQWRVRRTP
jgi:hypothetical protein